MAKNLNGLLQQAKQMQSKLSTLQKELDEREIDVTSGGGSIKVRINGKQEIIDLQIDPECIDPNDMGMLNDLVKVGINQAIKESQEMVSSAMSKVTGGLNIPGLF